jgi:hypothetical protein
MKHLAMSLLLGMLTMGAMAQETASDVNTDTQAVANPVASDAAAIAAEQDRLANMPALPAGTAASAAGETTAGHPPLPVGVTTEQNPLKVAFMAKSSSVPAYFRPNPNMPEIVNEDILRGMSENGKATGRNVNALIGYMPKLKIIPCPVDCSGDDYDKAVAAFVNGYEGEWGPHFQHRGEMIVQVRWFHARPWYARSLPYGTDSFGVSFMLEGKVVSLGKKSMVGGKVTADSLAQDIGSKMGFELAYSLGMGVKPSYINQPDSASNAAIGAVIATGNAVDHLLGADDVRPRVEQATESNSNLLPAVDGIQPNEIEPMTHTRYINTILF